MLYNPTSWGTGDLITDNKLNNIEGQIYRNTMKLESQNAQLNNLNSLVSTLNTAINTNIQEYVENWLNSHPEAITTIENNSIELNKLTTNLANQILNNYLVPAMFGAKGDGITNDTNAIKQFLAANGLKKFTSGKYLITETIEVESLGTICGDGTYPELIFKPPVSNVPLFLINYDGYQSFDNNISGLKVTATYQSDLSFLSCDKEKLRFNVSDCYIETSGYNFKFEGSWKYFSIIEKCWNRGGGFVYAVPKDQTRWVMEAYPHTFSNFTIRDCHFSALDGVPKGPLIFISGGYHTLIDNVEIEGFAKHFAPGYNNLGIFGSYITMINGSGILNNIWLESGGTNNVTGYDMSFISASNVSWGVGCQWKINNSRADTNIYVGKDTGISNNALPIIVIIDSMSTVDSVPKFNVTNFGFLILRNLLVGNTMNMADWTFNNPRIKLENFFKLDRNGMVGDLILVQ